MFLIKHFIKNYQNTSDQKVREEYAKLGSVVGIICNLLLFTIKFIIGILSGSVSIMADAFNNLSDIGSSVVTILGFKLSSKPADHEHPFGHGRLEYMSGFIVAVLITIVGVELLKSSVDKMIHPEPISAGTVTVIALIASIFIKLWLGFFVKRLGRAVNAGALIATSRDSFNDCIATTGVLVAVLISVFFKINIDPYMGLVVAGFIILSGIKTAKDTLDPLLGTPADPELIEEIKRRVLAVENFIDIHDLVVHDYGPGRVFATLHVEVPHDIDIIRCHEQIDTCERNVGEKLGLELVIHMDPIITDDEVVNDTKSLVLQKVKTINKNISIHDFRMVVGEKRTNLIFDIVVPIDLKLTKNEIIEKTDKLVKEIDDRYYCVITVDKDLSGQLG